MCYRHSIKLSQPKFSFKIISNLQSLMGQPHPSWERAKTGPAAPTSTHRVNLRQHCHNVSAQHLPSLPEDVPGQGISLLSAWGRDREGNGECLGSARAQLFSLSGTGQQQLGLIRNGCPPHGIWVSKPLKLPLHPTSPTPTPPGTSTLGRVSCMEVSGSRHLRREAPH